MRAQLQAERTAFTSDVTAAVVGLLTQARAFGRAIGEGSRAQAFDGWLRQAIACLTALTEADADIAATLRLLQYGPALATAVRALVDDYLQLLGDGVTLATEPAVLTAVLAVLAQIEGVDRV